MVLPVFDPSAVSGLLMLAQTFACPSAPPAIIEMNVTQSRPTIDHTRSYKDLATFKIDTISPYHHGEQSIVGGVMSGDFEVSTDMKFGIRTQTFLKKVVSGTQKLPSQSKTHRPFMWRANMRAMAAVMNQRLNMNIAMRMLTAQ